jgi:dynein heavy chain
METRPKDSSGSGGKSKEEVCQEKAKDILTKLPPDYNIPEVRATINKLSGPRLLNEKGIVVPSNTFLY